jgi:hypothetical protein
MASKRKNRNGKKRLTAAEQLQMVLNAIIRAGGCVKTFFRRAAEALSAKSFKPEREAAKFDRVSKEGIDKHRGYKIPQVALEFAKQQLGLGDSAASPKAHGSPRTMMRPSPAYA